MGRYAEKEWYRKKLAEFLNRYDAVPPPWVHAENSHPYSIRWRMGDGETLVMVFGEWWESKSSFEERLEYFRRWPPPPRWMAWMADALWDLEPWECEEGDFDYGPWFEKLKALGFEGIDDYEHDLDDEKWLEFG